MVFRGGADLHTARQKVVSLFYRQFGINTRVPECAECSRSVPVVECVIREKLEGYCHNHSEDYFSY